MNRFKCFSKKDKAEYIAGIALYPLMLLFGFLGKNFKLFDTKKRQIMARVLSFAMILTMMSQMMSLTAFAIGTGDITGDGTIDMKDVVALREHLLGTSTIDGEALNNADVTGDGVVNCDDYTQYYAYFNGKIALNGSFEISHHITITENITVYVNAPFSQSITTDTGLSEFACYSNPTGNLFSVDSTTGILTCNAVESNVGTYTLLLEGSCDDVHYAKVVTVTVKPDEQTVTSWSELQTAINAGGNIKLTQDIVAASTDSRLTVPSGITATIDLNGYKIDRALTSATDNGGVIYINGCNLTVNDTSTAKTGEITGGYNNGNGGGVYINSGTFTMKGGSITGNNANYGGGVFLNIGTFTMSGGSITGNNANYGGGVHSNGGTFTMSGGSISGNSAINDGGGVFVGSNCTFTLNDGSITNNTAANDCLGGGGGVYVKYGTFNMNGGNITGNKAFSFTGVENKGGGVEINDGLFTMTDGTITDNSANYGGGVYNWGTFNMNGGSITGNMSSHSGGGVYVNTNYKFNVSGKATVKDNTLADESRKSNVYFNDGYYPITVTGALTGEIGVTPQTAPLSTAPITITNVSTDPAYTLTADDVAKLYSDIDGYEVVKLDDVAILKKSLGTLRDDYFIYTEPTDLTCSGTAKTATVTAIDYVNCGAITVKYYKDGVQTNPIDIGTYIVKIDVEANCNYIAATDLEVGTFTITVKTLTDNDLTVTGINDEIYTENAIHPVPNVSYNGVTLVSGTDYTLDYGENTNIGNGSVTINFKGNYSGSATYNFSINYGTATTDMYSVPTANANGWYNNDIAITAKTGYTISKTASGLASSVTITDENANGSQDLYLKATDSKIYKGTFAYKLDKTAPTNIQIKYNRGEFKSFLNTITFGLFFKETVTIEVTATDALSGIDTIQYYAADSEVSDVTTITAWQNSLALTQNSKKIVYIKVTDVAGNSIITNNEGIVVDGTAPQISVTDGKTYCESVEVTVTDDNLNTVTLNGEAVNLTNGKFTVSSKDGTQTIVATDQAGNSTTVTITVYDSHLWDEGKITTEPTAANEGVKTYTCKHCGETRTEAIAKIAPTMIEGTNGKFTQGGKNGLTFKSDAALSDLVSISVDGNLISTDKYTTDSGSTIVTLKPTYLATLSVGKHTLDIKSASGTASTNFTIEAKSTDITKPVDTTKKEDAKSPKTGDISNMALWIALLFVSSGVLTTLGITKKRKKALLSKNSIKQ